jgi:RNA polymerase sigma-70 factor (ECF subfamily)
LERTDAELVKAAQGGDERAIRDLLGRYRTVVYNVAYRMLRNEEDATDAAQETFIRVFRALERFDERYKFKSWILRITSNYCIDQLRKRDYRTVSLDAPVETEDGSVGLEIAGSEPAPDEVLDREEQRMVIERAIDSLPPDHRMAIVLRHTEDLSYEEISDVLGVPLGTVKARIHRARISLQKKLTPYFEGGSPLRLE